MEHVNNLVKIDGNPEAVVKIFFKALKDSQKLGKIDPVRDVIIHNIESYEKIHKELGEIIEETKKYEIRKKYVSIIKNLFRKYILSRVFNKTFDPSKVYNERDYSWNYNHEDVGIYYREEAERTTRCEAVYLKGDLVYIVGELMQK